MRRTEDPTPVDAIGDVAAGKGKERDRQKHREPGVGEHHGVAGAVVQVPADRDRLHLQREGGEEPPGEKEVEVAQGKGVRAIFL